MDLLIQEHLRGFGHEPELPAPWLDPSYNRQPNAQQQRNRNHAPYSEEFALRIPAKENRDTDPFMRPDLMRKFKLFQSFKPFKSSQTKKPLVCLERSKPPFLMLSTPPHLQISIVWGPHDPPCRKS